MRIDWRNDPNAPRCRVINLDTGKQLIFCAMADDETGEYEQYRTVPTEWRKTGAREGEARFKFHIGSDGLPIVDRGKARLMITPLMPGDSYYLIPQG